MFSVRYVLVFLAVSGVFAKCFSQDNKQQAEDYLKVAELMREGSQPITISVKCW